MLQAVVLVLAFALLNRLRGWEWGKPYTSKGITSAVSGLLLEGVLSGWDMRRWLLG